MAPKPATRLFLTLLCVMVLVARFAGAHLHLCLDGQSPPVSVHWVDEDAGHARGLNAPHHDYDESIGAVAASKVGKAGFDLPAFLFATVLLLLLPRQVRIRPCSSPPVFPRHAPALLRPPVRGPPVLLSL